MVSAVNTQASTVGKVADRGAAAPVQDTSTRAFLTQINGHAVKLKELTGKQKASPTPNDPRLQAQIDHEKQAMQGQFRLLAEHVNKAGVEGTVEKKKSIGQTVNDMRPTLQANGVDLPKSLQDSLLKLQAVPSAVQTATAPPPVGGPTEARKGTHTPGDPVALKESAAQKRAGALAQQKAPVQPDPQAMLAVFDSQLDQKVQAANGDPQLRDAALVEYGAKVRPLLTSQGISGQAVEKLLAIKTDLATEKITPDEAEARLNELAQEIMAAKTATAGPQGATAPNKESGIGPSMVEDNLTSDGRKPGFGDIEDVKVRAQLEKQERALEQQRIVALLTAMMQQRHESLMAIIRSMGGGRG